MRTPLLTAAILGLFSFGCAGSLTGTGDDNPGDDVQSLCGNGAIDSGETCDDGNTLSGDGCSSTCAMEAVNTPRASIALDKTTLTTDLLVNNEVNITVASVNGFAGDVTLTATPDAGVMGWTTTFSATTITVPADGMVTAKVTLRVMGDTTSLSGNLKVTATSSGGGADAMIAVTANPTAVITYTTNNNNCVYPAEFALSVAPIRLTVGRKLRVVNASDTAGTACGGQACRMQIHFDGGSGIAHQPAPMNAGANYEQTATVANATGVTFYCHNANDATVAVESVGGNARQRLITMP